MRKAIVAAAGITFLASAALAGDHGKEASGDDMVNADAVSMPAEDIVTGRRASFFLSTQAIGQIKGGIAEDGDLRRTRGAARMLSRWAETIPKLFPEGTNIESSRALDTVWTDRVGFEARAAAYKAAALELAAKAETGDRAETQAAFMAMAGTCKACHDSYREE